MKFCYHCKIEKELIEFSKSSKESSGYQTTCKSCMREYRTINAQKLKERKKERAKEIAKIKKIYNQTHAKKIKEYSKKYAELNAEECKNRCREYKKNNKEKIRITRNRYDKIQRKINIQFRLKELFRSRLRYILKDKSKNASAVRDLGCSVEFCKSYLEAQFYSHPITGEPMTWNNQGKGYGKWQIHHVIPMHTIKNLDNHEQTLKVLNYQNLKPLWFEDHAKQHEIR